MEKVRQLLEKNLNENTLRAVVSNRRSKQVSQKLVFRPFMEKNKLMFQREEYANNQVFHENMDKETAVEQICTFLEKDYKQLDLKKDVIAHCNRMAEKYEYTSLHFLEGDISTYDGADSADMVITLHACDVATDFALDKAVHWNAKVILSVPCCQHELNAQIGNDMLEPLLKYGILKERFAALLTDALRANLLEQHGYEVQILEFIDMEHTPKNLLIRAIKRGEKADKKQEKLENSYKTLCDELNAHGTLEKILNM